MIFLFFLLYPTIVWSSSTFLPPAVLPEYLNEPFYAQDRLKLFFHYKLRDYYSLPSLPVWRIQHGYEAFNITADPFFINQQDSKDITNNLYAEFIRGTPNFSPEIRQELAKDFIQIAQLAQEKIKSVQRDNSSHTNVTNQGHPPILPQPVRDANPILANPEEPVSTRRPSRTGHHSGSRIQDPPASGLPEAIGQSISGTLPPLTGSSLVFNNKTSPGQTNNDPISRALCVAYNFKAQTGRASAPTIFWSVVDDSGSYVTTAPLGYKNVRCQIIEPRSKCLVHRGNSTRFAQEESHDPIRPAGNQRTARAQARGTTKAPLSRSLQPRSNDFATSGLLLASQSVARDGSNTRIPQSRLGRLIADGFPVPAGQGIPVSGTASTNNPHSADSTATKRTHSEVFEPWHDGGDRHGETPAISGAASIRFQPGQILSISPVLSTARAVMGTVAIVTRGILGHETYHDRDRHRTNRPKRHQDSAVQRPLSIPQPYSSDQSEILTIQRTTPTSDGETPQQTPAFDYSFPPRPLLRAELLDALRGGTSALHQLDHGSDNEATGSLSSSGPPQRPSVVHISQAEATETIDFPSHPDNSFPSKASLRRKRRSLSYNNTEVMRIMDAYDCSRPQDVTAISAMNFFSCPMPINPPILNSSQSSFQLLQSTSFTPLIAYECSIIISDIPAYCGATSHQTLNHEHFQIGQPFPVTYDQCQNVVNTNSFDLPYIGQNRNKTIRVPMNTTVHIAYTPLGKTVPQYNDFNCEGEVLYYKNMDRHSFVVYRSLQITLRKVEVLVRDDEATFLGGTRLHNCTVIPGRSQSFCKGPQEKTYVIEAKPLCSIQKLRRISGTVTTFKDKKIFVSNDGSTTHFVIGEKVSKCGVMVYQTNFQELFLLPHISDQFKSRTALQTFQEPRKDAMNSITYFNAKMAYFYKSTTDYAKHLYGLGVQDACISHKHPGFIKYSLLAAAQTAIESGITIKLGGNVFATPNGGVYYRYTCRPITVKAIDATSCFKGLPVELSPEDEKLFDEANSLSPTLNTEATAVERITNQERTYDNTRRYRHFIEPVTHRLTAAASTAPCSPMESLWRNAKGKWIAVSPYIHLPHTEPEKPRPYYQRAHSDDSLNPKEVSWEFGGIYDKAQIYHLNSFTLSHSKEKEVLTTLKVHLVDEIREGYEGSQLTFGVLSKAMGMSVGWAKIWWFFISFSQFISTMVAIYCCIKFIGWMVGLRHRLKIMKKKNPELQWAQFMCKASTMWPLLIPSLMTTFNPPDESEYQFLPKRRRLSASRSRLRGILRNTFSKTVTPSFSSSSLNIAPIPDSFPRVRSHSVSYPPTHQQPSNRNQSLQNLSTITERIYNEPKTEVRPTLQPQDFYTNDRVVRLQNQVVPIPAYHRAQSSTIPLPSDNHAPQAPSCPQP